MITTDDITRVLVDRATLRQKALNAIPHEARIELARFCSAFKSCFHDDPRRHALMEGRREVWLFLEQHWEMTPEQLAEIYRSAGITVTKLQGDDDDE